MCFPEPAPAVQTLEYFREAGLPGAVVLADHWMPDMTGAQLLVRAHELHPQAKRVLLFAWGDRTSQGPILEASALGLMDTYARKPSQSPDEQFHRVITELLEEWTQTQGPRFIAVRIVGDQWAPRSHELRDLLGRNGIPFEFHAAWLRGGAGPPRGGACRRLTAPSAVPLHAGGSRHPLRGPIERRDRQEIRGCRGAGRRVRRRHRWGVPPDSPQRCMPPPRA
jgi:CheY-like chemotaxis protein